MDPQPGEALLACRRGDTSDAWTAIRLALAGQRPAGRVRLLRAAVEIALGRDALDEAESYCRELEADAEAFGTPGFRAWAAHARGALAVRRGQYDAALESSAGGAARVPDSAVALRDGRGLRVDGVGASGAGRRPRRRPPMLRRPTRSTPNSAWSPPGSADRRPPGGLTRRELEVLAAHRPRSHQSASGAAAVVSVEKTVGRHLANIYAKLGVSSRTAAATWARDNTSRPALRVATSSRIICLRPEIHHLPDVAPGVCGLASHA